MVQRQIKHVSIAISNQLSHSHELEFIQILSRFGSTPPKSRATQAPSLVGRTSYRMRLTSLKPGSGWRSAVGSIDAQRGRQGMHVGEEKQSLKSVDRFFGTQIHATLLTRPKYYVRF